MAVIMDNNEALRLREDFAGLVKMASEDAEDCGYDPEVRVMICDNQTGKPVSVLNVKDVYFIPKDAEKDDYRFQESDKPWEFAGCVVVRVNGVYGEEVPTIPTKAVARKIYLRDHEGNKVDPMTMPPMPLKDKVFLGLDDDPEVKQYKRDRSRWVRFCRWIIGSPK